MEDETPRIKGEVFNLLRDHKGTAGMFCRTCIGYAPPEEFRNILTDQELTYLHQADMVAEYFASLRRMGH